MDEKLIHYFAWPNFERNDLFNKELSFMARNASANENILYKYTIDTQIHYR